MNMAGVFGTPAIWFILKMMLPEFGYFLPTTPEK